MNKKRFEFEDGAYWEVYAEQTWGAQRATGRLALTMLKLDAARADIVQGVITAADVDPLKWDPDAINEVLLLHSTVAWSYGPIAAETLARIPSRHVSAVLDYVNEVYPQSDPLAIAALSNGVRKDS